MAFDFSRARENMVQQQVRPWHTVDERVLKVMSLIPREAFVPDSYRQWAYADTAIPLCHDQTTLRPMIEARLLDALNLQGTERVLEIGSGSGTMTAALGLLARQVVSLDLELRLVQSAQAALQVTQLWRDICLVHADALQWTCVERFDVICCPAAVTHIPDCFFHWLRPNGQLLILCGSPPTQEVLLIRQTGQTRHTIALFETAVPYLRGAEPQPHFCF